MSEIAPVKSKVQIWRERIEEQVQSGKSVRVFCEEHQLTQNTFFYWRKKFRDKPGPKGTAFGRRFIPVSGALPWASVSPRIYLLNGVRIELGAGLESEAVDRFLLGLCGVDHPPKDGHRAKP